MEFLGADRGPPGAVDVDDDRAGRARVGEIFERFEAILVAADDTADGDPRNLRTDRLHEAAARSAEHHGDADDGRDGDQDGHGAPERELAPHTAAIDDMVGIERHVWSP